MKTLNHITTPVILRQPAAMSRDHRSYVTLRRRMRRSATLGNYMTRPR